MTKTELIHVRVTPQEKDLIAEWAAAEGRSVASLIHHRLFLSAGAAVDRRRDDDEAGEGQTDAS